MATDAPTVTLRPLLPADADLFARWARDDEFCRRADWDGTRSTDDHCAFHLQLIRSPPVDLLRLGVVHQGALVGYVDLHGDEPRRRELGFVIGERHRWGQGLGRAAAAAAVDHGFRDLDLDEVRAEAADANQPSIRILRSLGMLETGRGDDGTYLGLPTHYRQFAITGPRWVDAQP